MLPSFLLTKRASSPRQSAYPFLYPAFLPSWYPLLKASLSTSSMSLPLSTAEKSPLITQPKIVPTIMPIANRYSIEEIVKALKSYVKENGRRVVFEYCLIKDVNNTAEDIQRLKQITKGLLSHVNVICLNPNGGSLKAITRQEAIEFVNKLNEAGISATLRRSQGSDIEGACGMLRAKTLKENN